MVDKSRKRMLKANCVNCGSDIGLFILKPNQEIEFANSANTSFNTICPNCKTKVEIPATVVEEVEMT